MKKKNISLAGCDKAMILIIMALLFYGSLMVFSASAPYAESTYGDSYYFVKRQLFWVALGLLGFSVCASLPAEVHKDVTAPFGFAIAAVCLVLVLFSGSAVKRWLDLGFFSFQPSEFMKPMLVLMLWKTMLLRSLSRRIDC
jgi:cell division protein FtsW